MRFSLRQLGHLACACMLAACSTLPQHQADDYLARVELLALLQTFNAELLSHDSATLTLERWCADHRLAGDVPAAQVHIVARRVHDAIKSIPDELRARLNVAADEPIRYRHVQLVCGESVLSEADNWYVPSRLTPEMNRQLDTTDEPFGKVVKALGFQRRTLSAELLWSPLPMGWEMNSAERMRVHAREPLRMPHAMLRHQAVLYTSVQLPFSAVVETYTERNFDFESRTKE
jgi:chorismate-pyruvate lyase